MGRLQVEIRHGHDGGPAQWGAVVALIVLVLFAAAGHREIAAMLHEVLTIAAITVLSMAGAALLFTAAVIAFRVRAARRARRAPVVIRLPNSVIRLQSLVDDRPALDEPRRAPGTWPLPGQWGEITPRDGDDRRRYS